MLNSVKKVLPRPIKERIEHLLTSPSISYTRRTVGTYRDRLLRNYPQKYQVDKAPLIENFSNYEVLFKDSEQNFEAIIAPYTSEFRWPLGRVYNFIFVSVDAELYYSMIRQYQPNLIIEIGCGHSTHFAMDAVKKNQAGHILCIDPEPRIKLPKGVSHIQAKVEDVDMDVFTELGENDMLFIDSSHTTEEALYHCKQILPNLGAGVIIHHHDFTYPYRIYYGDDPIAFGEPDVLLEFYMENKRSFEVMVCASYVRYKNFELVNRLVKSYRWNPGRVPGSLWARKKTL